MKRILSLFIALFVVGSIFGQGCINPNQIDTTVICPAIWSPVCGCDGITYANYCEAQNYAGVTQWTPGPCAAMCSAGYGYTIGTNGQVWFNDLSTATDPIVSYSWNFGDGNFSNQQNPNHTYASTGWYYVCLSIGTSNQSCFDTYCDSIYVQVSNPCVTGFTYTSTSLCDVSFSAQAPLDAISWYWDFGDGNSSTSQNPTHTFSGEGPYYVCLSTVDSFGCQSSYCDSLYIQGCGMNCINPGQIDSSTVCPTVSMPVCGCDGVTYDNSCIAEYYGGVTQWTQGPCGQQCTAIYTYTVGTNGQVWFNDLSSATDPIVSYSWNFGDGNFSTQQNPNHTYATSGWYYVCLSISTANQSCFDTYCDSIYVQVSNPCVTGFSYVFNSVCEATFTTQAPQDAISWYWDFGDGNSATTQNATHTFSGQGPFNVCLSTVDSMGCQSTYCDSIYVQGCIPTGCDADFVYTWGFGGSIHFSDASTSAQPITDWYWTFGDGVTSTSENPVHTYSGSGAAEVCLTITTADSCQDTFCDSLWYQGPPLDCIDSTIIDDSAACPAWAPLVCGCDGVTYNNGCEAYYWYGVTSHTPGPCNPNSIEGLSEDHFSFIVHPNPTRGFFSIRFLEEAGEDVFIRVLSVDGKEIGRDLRSAEQLSSGSLRYSTENMASGLYLIEVTTGGKSQFQKLHVLD